MTETPSEMTPQTSTLRPMAGFRWLAIAVVSLVLGLWGVYDYAVKIPADAAKHERFQIARHVAAALENANLNSQEFREQRDGAIARIDAELAELGKEPAALDDRSAVAAEIDSMRPAIATVDSDNLDAWLTTLAIYQRGLNNPTRVGSTLSGWSALAWELTQPVINAFGSVTPPATFDRMVQWAFIACLPAFPWYLIVYFRAKSKKYKLTAEGKLHLPGEEDPWSLDLITGIDMSQWMSKSIATVNHTSARSAVLDDHLYKDLHLIIGQLAHYFEPGAWTEDARPVKKPTEEAHSTDAEPITTTDDATQPDQR